MSKSTPHHMQTDYFVQTMKHIRLVQDIAVQVSYAMDDDYKWGTYIEPITSQFGGGDNRSLLLNLVARHDLSKFDVAEVEGYSDIIFGNGATERFHIAVAHHYRVNPHHPEHHAGGIMDMDACVVLEMLCDWIAASIRAGNDPIDWLPTAKERFRYPDSLDEPFLNFIKYFSPVGESSQP